MLGQTLIQSGLTSFGAGIAYGAVVIIGLGVITLLFNKFNHTAK
ncbi:hypothetical protein [Companilactobacillus furfuricola]|nr:hypothetical protein [Companilactobacillus furfuricola]